MAGTLRRKDPYKRPYIRLSPFRALSFGPCEPYLTESIVLSHSLTTMILSPSFSLVEPCSSSSRVVVLPSNCFSVVALKLSFSLSRTEVVAVLEPLSNPNLKSPLWNAVKASSIERTEGLGSVFPNCVCASLAEESGLANTVVQPLWFAKTFIWLVSSISSTSNCLTDLGIRVPSHDNQLLKLAEDLGKRSLAAFDTPSGIMTINSGVHVKGLTEGGEDDFYGLIKHIYELEYTTSMIEKKIVLFYCDWFDPSRTGTRVDSKYGIVDIRLDKRYVSFDPFIIAHNVEQVYYVPYPASRTDKRGWCVAIKTKPRGRIDSNEVEVEVPYQVEEMSHVNDIIEVEEVIRLQDIEAGLEEVDPNNVPSVEGYMDEETSELEEECSEEGQSEDEDEDSFHTSSSE
ncbi:hypothetical protein V8G54_004491 [Vigna mungo]|uniref:DUF4216 domain-containing protein n=1 Tax=Vigna mungo TaxID=3915 RepID=A0AAQ3PDX1_VIGMU